jgi:SWI/SNF-related matrix-associated actin-dependent regulator of chromatin subfamily A member 5
LREKLSQYRAPLQQLQIQYNQNKGKVYTEEEDRFLLVQLDKFGLGREDLYDRIREEIRESPLFRFDWFFLSRTSLEIQRRCTTLLTMIMREFGESEKRGLEDDDSRESTPTAKKVKKAGNKIVESLKVFVFFDLSNLQNKQSASLKGSKQTSRASSVGSTVSSNVTNGRKALKKKR